MIVCLLRDGKKKKKGISNFIKHYMGTYIHANTCACALPGVCVVDYPVCCVQTEASLGRWFTIEW